ncbi:DUF3010 family protein [Halopseudomonas sp.]|uniref:DUF3010 family protein n=1 Tax=Halopseudomonas sp. TaxID=2901191 RepID=UPI00311F2B54
MRTLVISRYETSTNTPRTNPKQSACAILRRNHRIGLFMKVCGVDLNSNDANLCLLSLEDELFQLPDFRSRRLSLTSTHNASDLRYFQQTFAKLMEDYKVDTVVIRQRPIKGKFAGGAVGFKLEAAIELIADLDVVIMSPTDIKESIKRNPIAVPFAETGLKAYQETAFNTAYAYLMQAKYAD